MPAAAGSHPASLIVIDPTGNRSKVRIDSFPFRIGRQGDNRLVLRDGRISRVHAQITVEGGDYFVEDLQSRYGVYVNEERVSRQHLKGADRIEFGFPDSYRLVFTREEAEVSLLAEKVTTAAPLGAGGGNLAKLRALVEVARALESAISTDDVLAALVDATLAITGAERGFLLLRENDELNVRVARDRKGEALGENDLRVPRGVINRALRQRRELLSMNFDPGAEVPSRTVVDLELRSVVCVPLVKVRAGTGRETGLSSPIEDTLGLLYMDSRIGAADLSAGNRELLQTLALEASTILENARLLEGDRQRQRMEEELKIARGIQESLLPRQLPSAGWFRAAGRSIPSLHVGGDYFEVGEISDTSRSVVAADVSGKGVSAALLASLLQGIFLASPENDVQMERMMGRVNQFLNERTGGEKYATVFYCTLERSGLLRWINAGHCPPLLVRTGEKLWPLEATGFPVGMLEEAIYKAEEVRLRPGDKLVIYTDGLSEAQSPDGRFFGEKRIREVLLANVGGSCQGVYDALERSVTAFTSGAVQRDDITLLVVEFRPE